MPVRRHRYLVMNLTYPVSKGRSSKAATATWDSHGTSDFVFLTFLDPVIYNLIQFNHGNYVQSNGYSYTFLNIKMKLFYADDTHGQLF